MKILVVDDHALFREGLVYMLGKLETETTIIEANNYEEAVALLESHLDLDLALFDLSMPGKDGFSLLDYCRKQFPLVSVVILSASKNSADLSRAIKAGALGFIPKDTTSKVMLSALQLIMTGERYIPASMSLQPQLNDIDNALTPRQQQVASMMMKGFSNKKIALEIGIAEATIKMHVTSIFKRLGVQNRTEATLAMQQLGMSELR